MNPLGELTLLTWENLGVEKQQQSFEPVEYDLFEMLKIVATQKVTAIKFRVNDILPQCKRLYWNIMY